MTAPTPFIYPKAPHFPYAYEQTCEEAADLVYLHLGGLFMNFDSQSAPQNIDSDLDPSKDTTDAGAGRLALEALECARRCAMMKMRIAQLCLDRAAEEISHIEEKRREDITRLERRPRRSSTTVHTRTPPPRLPPEIFQQIAEDAFSDPYYPCDLYYPDDQCDALRLEKFLEERETLAELSRHVKPVVLESLSFGPQLQGTARSHPAHLKDLLSRVSGSPLHVCIEGPSDYFVAECLKYGANWRDLSISGTMEVVSEVMDTCKGALPHLLRFSAYTERWRTVHPGPWEPPPAARLGQLASASVSCFALKLFSNMFSGIRQLNIAWRDIDFVDDCLPYLPSGLRMLSVQIDRSFEDFQPPHAGTSLPGACHTSPCTLLERLDLWGSERQLPFIVESLKSPGVKSFRWPGLTKHLPQDAAEIVYALQQIECCFPNLEEFNMCVRNSQNSTEEVSKTDQLSAWFHALLVPFICGNLESHDKPFFPNLKKLIAPFPKGVSQELLLTSLAKRKSVAGVDIQPLEKIVLSYDDCLQSNMDNVFVNMVQFYVRDVVLRPVDRTITKSYIFSPRHEG